MLHLLLLLVLSIVFGVVVVSRVSNYDENNNNISVGKANIPGGETNATNI